MCTQYETRWCYYQILVLTPQYPVLPNYTPGVSEKSCVFTLIRGGASTKYWFQNNTTQYYQITPPALQKTHVYSVCKQVVLVPNISFSTTISSTTKVHPYHFGKLMGTQCETRWCQMQNIGLSTTISSTTKLHPQHFGKLMCTQYETRWCQCQILVLASHYPVLPNYTTSTSENSCVLSVKTGGASTKYWFQHHNIQHYQITPPTLRKTHVHSV